MILSFSKSQILKILFFFCQKNSQNRRNNVNDFQKNLLNDRNNANDFQLNDNDQKKKFRSYKLRFKTIMSLLLNNYYY